MSNPPPTSRAEEIARSIWENSVSSDPDGWLTYSGCSDGCQVPIKEALIRVIAKALEDYAKEARDAERASVCQYGKEQRYKGLTEGAASMRERAAKVAYALPSTLDEIEGILSEDEHTRDRVVWAQRSCKVIRETIANAIRALPLVEGEK